MTQSTAAKPTESHYVLGEMLRPGLTIVTQGNAARFFKQLTTEIAMNPPDVEVVLRVGAQNAITFLA